MVRRELIDVLAAQESLVQTVDASVEFSRSKATDCDKYFVDLETYKKEVNSFYHVPYKQRQPLSVTHNVPDPKRYFRVWRNAKGYTRCDEFVEAPKDGDQALKNIFCRSVSRESDGSDFSRTTLGILACIGRPIEIPTRSGRDRPSGAANNVESSDNIRRLGAANTAAQYPLDIREHSYSSKHQFVRLRLTFPRPKRSLMCRWWTWLQSIRLEEKMAPIGMNSDWMLFSNQQLRPFDLPRGLETEWNDFSEVHPGLWLPRSWENARYSSLAFPLDSDGLQLTAAGWEACGYQWCDSDRYVAHTVLRYTFVKKRTE